MLDSRAFDGALLTAREMDAHSKVHAYKMRKAEVVRKVIAHDLGGTLPAKGRQYLAVGNDRWRIAMESSSDNSTEVAAHGLVGAVCVVWGAAGARVWPSRTLPALRSPIRRKASWRTSRRSY
jgi:hypothetical protein